MAEGPDITGQSQVIDLPDGRIYPRTAALSRSMELRIMFTAANLMHSCKWLMIF